MKEKGEEGGRKKTEGGKSQQRGTVRKRNAGKA